MGAKIEQPDPMQVLRLESPARSDHRSAPPQFSPLSEVEALLEASDDYAMLLEISEEFWCQAILHFEGNRIHAVAVMSALKRFMRDVCIGSSVFFFHFPSSCYTRAA